MIDCKSNDTIALDIIEEWEKQGFKNECQRKARLQCMIIEQLNLKDEKITATFADYEASKNL